MAARRIALQARDLVVQAGQQVLLHRLSLALHPGEVTAIIGPSGAGKSTLLKALCGFRPANSGRMLANGQDLYQSFDVFRPLLGYVPQDDIIHRDLSVFKALYYAALLRLPAAMSESERKGRIDAVLQQLGLMDRCDLLIRKLSGGQRKRVSIGVELLSSPPLLFLDEPTSGLDPGLEEKMMVLLQGLAREGRTVVLTTHAMQSLELADFLAVINRGYLAYFGPPAAALLFFQTGEIGELFKQLDKQAPANWEAAYQRSPLFKTYISDRLAQGPVRGPVAEGEPAGGPAAKAPPARTVEDELAELKKQLGKQDP